MTTHPPSSIVVGVDGTPAGQAALSYAMQEAALRGSSLEVVTTWEWTIPYDTAFQDDPTETRLRAEQAQERAVTAVLVSTPAPPMITRHVLEGDAGTILVRLARHAACLVVGSTHKNALKRAVLGSVSQHCVRHATCPVVVVPAGAPVGALAAR
jgi:nucleotide-binding universal stress UspA family protein